MSRCQNFAAGAAKKTELRVTARDLLTRLRAITRGFLKSVLRAVLVVCESHELVRGACTVKT